MHLFAPNSFLLSLLATVLLPPIANAQSAISNLNKFPSVLYECDGDQCTRGGGGAIWVFEGRRGQAMWHYGAVADLTIEAFDGRNFVIRRVDPAGTYSSRFAPPGQLFTAVYKGTIDGDHINGTVPSWHGTWYARTPSIPCSPFAECPLDINQVSTLGQNAFNAKEYSAALLCFLISAGQGNADAEGVAGLMLLKGIGTSPDYEMAFRMLRQSAEQDDVNGEIGLARMYELGLGPVKQRNPDVATFLAGLAKHRSEELEARRQQTQNVAGISAGDLLLGVMAAAGGVTFAQAIFGHGNGNDPNDARGSSTLLDELATHVVKKMAEKAVDSGVDAVWQSFQQPRTESRPNQ